MASDRLFGTDGIRGQAGEPPLDHATVARIGRALADDLALDGRRPRVLLGRDTRESGPGLERALASGLQAGGADVVTGGVLPTPAVARLVRDGDWDGGVVLSASHNPYRDNGLKFFSGDGYKLGREHERSIEERVRTSTPVPDELEPPPLDDSLAGRYAEVLRAAVGADFSLAGRRVVVDCANGAASTLAPSLFRELGAEVTALACSPDGININPPERDGPHGRLRAEVRERGAFLGAAYDGDADRCILVDETGTVRDGDDILIVAAEQMTAAGTLGGTVVSTVMANFGFESYLESRGLELVRTDVGDKYVLAEMVRLGARLGGEQSGHVIFLDHATTGDGLLTSLLLARMVIESGQPLSKLAAGWTRTPQLLRNVRVAAKPDLAGVPPVATAVARAEEQLAGRGRVLVRYSGTEPLARVMLEGPDRDELETLAEGLIETLARALA